MPMLAIFFPGLFGSGIRRGPAARRAREDHPPEQVPHVNSTVAHRPVVLHRRGRLVRWILPAILVSAVLANAGECVILLHGLARTSKSMGELARRLEEKHYIVENVDYNSREGHIDSLAQSVIPSALKRLEEKRCDKVNFVTHSMGGILVRSYLATNQIPNLGRVVMLGPPNAGSEVVDQLKDWSFFQALNGPAGSELGTDSLSTPNRLGPVRFELGVIAGDRSINGINSLLMIPGNDDGKVSVANTKVPGMKDHIVIHATHPMMMTNKQVIEQILRFLKTGAFRH